MRPFVLTFVLLLGVVAALAPGVRAQEAPGVYVALLSPGPDADGEVLVPVARRGAAFSYDDVDSLFAYSAGRVLAEPAFAVRPHTIGVAPFGVAETLEPATAVVLLMPGLLSHRAHAPGEDVAASTTVAAQPAPPAEVVGAAGLEAMPEALLAFRDRHPAVERGRHQAVARAPYTFWRTYREGLQQDDVVVVMGAEGRTTVKVAHAFADDSVVRDAMTGRIGLVTYGTVALEAHASGLMLIEALED